MLAARRGARVHAVESMPVAELACGLVSCLFRSGRPPDGERMLRAYEEYCEWHPEQWCQKG
jgi:hypothetical protein